MKIQVYVVSHSEEDIQDIDANDIYVPLFVGRDGKDNLGFVSDDTGDNISSKNSSYCELTGLYWMWKNSTADIIGLVHYRRHFSKKSFGKPINRKDIEEILKDYDISDRQKMILYEVMTNNKTYGEIAIKHNLSTSLVKKDMTGILQYFGCKNANSLKIVLSQFVLSMD